MNPLASLVEKKLAAMPVAVRLQMPDGQWLGPKDAQVEFVAMTAAALKNLAAGDIGKIGEDYVEGRVEVNGSMRDLMAAATALLPGNPVDAARQAPSRRSCSDCSRYGGTRLSAMPSRFSSTTTFLMSSMRSGSIRGGFIPVLITRRLECRLLRLSRPSSIIFVAS